MSIHTPSDKQPVFSPRGRFWMLIIAALLGLLWSVIIPPLKSLDEPDHVRRAYILANGQWMLNTQACGEEGPSCKSGHTMSGGMVDRGLAEYLTLRDVQNSEALTMTRSVEQGASAIRWRGEDTFVITPGTSYYFPLVYLPQALGLKLGKILNLRVQQSYYLARFMSLACTIAVLMLAFSIFPPSLTTVALLLIPMSLFQGVSASLDPFSSALAVLGMACFQRLMTQKALAPRGLFLLMVLTVFVVATTRAHLAPMVLMLFSVAWVLRRRSAWALASLCTACILGWLALAIPQAVDFRVARSLSTGETVSRYMEHPGDLISLFYRTLTDPGMQMGMRASFIGAFQGVGIPGAVYTTLTVMLVLCVAVSVARKDQLKSTAFARSVLFVTGGSACVLALLAMALTWTEYGAQVIDGVQGMYFLVPVIFMLCALADWGQITGRRKRLGESLVGVLFLFGFLSTTYFVMQGYYVPWRAQARETMTEVRVSPRLSSERPVEIHFEDASRKISSEVSRVGIRFATYMTTFDGEAKLTVHGSDGRHETVSVPLATARDNQYLYVQLPAGPWESAELDFSSATPGPSVWEAHHAGPDGRVSWQSCVILEAVSGARQLTDGCSPQ